MAEHKLELHSPLTEEDWDLITDVDLDHTPSVMFHTKHGKDVEYVKVKHGRWLDAEPAPWGQVYETCSECGIRQTLDKGKDNFCGVCGAQMDEQQEVE